MFRCHYPYRITQPLLNEILHGLGILISKGQIDVILAKNSVKLKSTYLCLKAKAFLKNTYLGSNATGGKQKNKRRRKIISINIVRNLLPSFSAITRHYTLNRLLMTGTLCTSCLFLYFLDYYFLFLYWHTNITSFLLRIIHCKMKKVTLSIVSLVSGWRLSLGDNIQDKESFVKTPGFINHSSPF